MSRDNDQNRPPQDPIADLTALVAAHERVDWDAVRMISAPEAAAWTARLEAARDDLAARRPIDRGSESESPVGHSADDGR